MKRSSDRCGKLWAVRLKTSGWDSIVGPAWFFHGKVDGISSNYGIGTALFKSRAEARHAIREYMSALSKGERARPVKVIVTVKEVR